MIAAGYGHTDTVNALRRHGASIEDDDGIITDLLGGFGLG